MIYFDNAATSRFKPENAKDALIETFMNSSNFSRASHSDAINLATKIALFRELILSTLNAKQHEVIFTPSCTEALNLAIFGVCNSLKNPFHVIISAYEHNSVIRPINALAVDKKISYSVIYPNDNLKINPIDIKNAIKKDTKLMVLNLMSNVTGSVLDIEPILNIAKENNIIVIVDAAQAIGHINIDMENIDYLAAPGHKGLHGPQGIGFLVANTSYKLSHIMYGGSGIKSDSLNQPDVYPDGYEVGTLNAPGIVSLYESFKYTYKYFESINNKIKDISTYIYQNLKNINGIKLYSVENSPVISIAYKNFSSSKLSDYLNSNNIASRSGLHCAPYIHSYFNTLKSGLCRLSIGYNNSFDEAHYLLKVLSKLNRIY